MADRNNHGSDKQPPEAVVPPGSDVDAILAALASQGMNLDAEGIQGLLRRTLEACPELRAGGFKVVDDRPGAKKTVDSPVRLEAFHLMQEAAAIVKEIPSSLAWVQAPPDAHVLACEQGSWIMDPPTTVAWFNHHLSVDGLEPLTEEEVAAGLYPDKVVKQLLLAANQDGLSDGWLGLNLDSPDCFSDMAVNREKVIEALRDMRAQYVASHGHVPPALPDLLRCPLSGVPFTRPVTLSDGWTYEYEALILVLETYAMMGTRSSPLTGEQVQPLFVDNLTIKAWVDGWDPVKSIRANVLAIPLKVYDLGVPELALGDESERAPSP